MLFYVQCDFFTISKFVITHLRELHKGSFWKPSYPLYILYHDNNICQDIQNFLIPNIAYYYGFVF